MEFKGTKGEWEVNKYDSIVSNGKMILIHGGLACTVHDDEEAKANSQLIAAAPELLKQLQECQDMITKMSEHNIGGGRILGKTYISNVWKENEKVLNKALNK